jgi:hypothetical protein
MKLHGKFSTSVTLVSFSELTWRCVTPKRHRLHCEANVPVLGPQFLSYSRNSPCLWNPKVLHCVHTRPPLDSVRGQPNPGHAYRLYFFKMWFNIIILHMPRSSKGHLSFTLQTVNLMHVSHPPCILNRLHNLTHLTNLRHRLRGWEVDGAGSGSYRVQACECGGLGARILAERVLSGWVCEWEKSRIECR